MRLFGSVRAKLVAAIIGLLVVVASASAALSYQLIFRGIVKAQDERLQQLASYEAAQIDWTLAEYASKLRQIALSEAAERYATQSAYYSLDRLFSDSNDSFPTLSYIDEKGVEELKYIQGKESDELYELGGNGLIRKASEQPNRAHIGMLPDRFGNQPKVGFVFSVRNFFGEYGGTLLGVAPLSQFTRNLRTQSIGRTGYFLVADHSGTVMLRSDESAHRLNSGDVSASGLTTSSPEAIGAVPQFIDKHAGSAPVNLLPLTVHAVLPSSEFLAEPKRLIVLLGLIAASIMLLAGALAWAIGSAVMRPLKKLVSLTKAIGRGDFSKGADIDSGDEFEQLGDAFNRMIEQRQSAEEKLKKSRDMAEAGERVKSEFLATMTHEIRTPLNGVIGMAEILGKTNLSAQQREYLETIKDSGHYLGNLIDDILDFSKIEAGEVEIACDDFDLRNLVDEVAVMLAAAAHEKNLDLCVLLPTDAPLAVRGDAGRLRQVLVNIVGNAVKFTDKGEIVIRVVPLDINDDFTRFRFEVSDTGIGIDAKDHERIFESFRQSDSFQTRTRGGTGLGLAICRQLVGVMGGQIGVDSKIGHGACVWFELPLVLQPGAEHSAFNVHPSITAMRVLVAESHPTSARVIGELLSEWGASCDFALTSRDALSMLRDSAAFGKPYDLAILERDIGGSRVNGVFHEITQDAAIRDTRLIVLGTYKDFESVANSTIPDSAVRLRKPMSLQQLHDAVAGITSSAGTAAEPEPSKAAAEIAAAGARILAVEDNAVNLHVLRTMLELMGCHVDAAVDGREGVGAAISGDYDLVFMDCQMPEVDGYEASRRIRREEQRRSVARATPIIALTANVKSGERERCLKAGMNDYMSKPFTEEQLSDMLRRHLNEARKSRARLPCAARQRGPLPLEGSTENSVIDSKVIEKLRRLQERTKRDVLRETVHLFHESSQASLDALRTAVRAGDAAGIRDAAHSLKSSSYIVGAKRLGDLCRRLEEQARMNHTESSNDLLQRVEPEYESVRDRLGSALTASG